MPSVSEPPSDDDPLSVIVSTLPPAAPADAAVLQAVNNLAEFVCRSGSQFEALVRSRHPEPEPGLFRFLHDTEGDDYAYYQWKIKQLQAARQDGKDGERGLDESRPEQQASEEREQHMQRADTEAAPGTAEPAAAEQRGVRRKRSRSSTPSPPRQPRSPSPQRQRRDSVAEGGEVEQHSAASSSSSSLSLMAQYVQQLQSSDGNAQRSVVPPPPTVQSVLSSFNLSASRSARQQRPSMSSSSSFPSSSSSSPLPELDESNVGFHLLRRMGWKEGEGLGKKGDGITTPLQPTGQRDGMRPGLLPAAAAVRTEVRTEAAAAAQQAQAADPYEAYKNKMKERYKGRPNPLNNPRHSYY